MSSKSVTKLFLFAGEASADLHGAELIKSLKAHYPDISIAAVAGPRMRELGVKCLMRMEEFQVMGFTDVILSLPKLSRSFFIVRKLILEANPEMALFIDYPGFNLRMQKSLRKKGFQGTMVQFICPTVWAWAKKRINIMVENLDLLLTIFPFEKDCFSHTSLPVYYIGNPVTSSIQSYKYHPNWKSAKKVPKNKRVIAIFPGSRAKEIQKNIPIQLNVAKKLLKEDPDLFFCISVSQKNFETFMRYWTDWEFEEGKEFLFIDGSESYDLMQSADLAIATSGTVTLELALHQVPTVVTYGIKPFDQFIAQKLLKINLSYYCIVNIIGKKEIFPELFGSNLQEKRLHELVQHLLQNEGARTLCKAHCKEISATLEEKKPSEEAALAILSRLQTTRSL